MKYLILLISACCINICTAQTTSKEVQIKSAVLAAPEAFRAGAKVYGYDDYGQFVVLREGNNNYICIADDPNKNGFQVVCYFSDLEPFMERGRQLRKKGMKFQEVYDTREKEAKDGSLKMPENPSILFIYYGNEASYDEQANALTGGKFRYVVYIPFATQESTGLPLKAYFPGHPWLMDPGKHNAHIMITPVN